MTHLPSTYRIERHACRNLPWAAARLTPAERAVLGHALASPRDKLVGAFLGVFAMRRGRYRLLAADGGVLARTHRSIGERRLDVRVIYAVKGWREVKAQPGTYTPRVDPMHALSFLDAPYDDGARDRFQSLPADTDLVGVPMSRELIGFEIRSRSAISLARQ